MILDLNSLEKSPDPLTYLVTSWNQRDASASKNLQWSLMTHLNSLEESPIVILHQPAVQHNLQTTFCKSGNSETGMNTVYITCRLLFVKSRFEKNWIYRFLSVFVYEVLNLVPHRTEDLERIENITFVLLYADDIKILTLASIWPLAPLVPPKGWLDTKESLAVKVFV